MIGREGTAKKSKRKGALPPVPSYFGKLTKRVDQRARIALDHDDDVTALNAVSGVLLLVEADFDDGFFIVAAEVYAVHPEHRLIDVHLRSPLPPDTHVVQVKRTGLGLVP